MTIYYVSLGGNDANSGLTAALPFRTWSRAATEGISHNEFVFIGGGHFDEDMVIDAETDFIIRGNYHAGMPSLFSCTFNKVTIEDSSDFAVTYIHTYGGSFLVKECDTVSLSNIRSYEYTGIATITSDSWDGGIAIVDSTNVTGDRLHAYRHFRGAASKMCGVLLYNVSGVFTDVMGYYTMFGIAVVENLSASPGSLTMSSSRSYRSTTCGIIIMNKHASFTTQIVNCSSFDSMNVGASVEGDTISGEFAVIHHNGTTNIFNCMGFSSVSVPLNVRDAGLGSLNINYNNWYTKSSVGIVRQFGFGTYSSIAEWRSATGQDINSYSEDPALSWVECCSDMYSVMSTIYDKGNPAIAASLSKSFDGSKACIGSSRYEKYRDTVLYVRVSGNDGNTGLDPANALRSPKRAAQIIDGTTSQSGTMYIGAGDYSALPSDGGDVITSSARLMMVYGDIDGSKTGDAGIPVLRDVIAVLNNARIIAANISCSILQSTIGAMVFADNCTVSSLLSGVASSFARKSDITAMLNIFSAANGISRCSVGYIEEFGATTVIQEYPRVINSSIINSYLIELAAPFIVVPPTSVYGNLFYADLIECDIIQDVSDPNTNLFNIINDTGTPPDPLQEDVFHLNSRGNILLNRVASTGYLAGYETVGIQEGVESANNSLYRPDGSIVIDAHSTPMTLTTFQSSYPTKEVGSEFGDPRLVNLD